MASFRIHEDQENSTALALRKENEVFGAQRRALGDLNQFTGNQTRNAKIPLTTGVPSKIDAEKKIVREKSIVPPVAQFRAFSVYEDKPSEKEAKKREPATYKPFASKENKLNIENALPNTFTLIENKLNVEKTAQNAEVKVIVAEKAKDVAIRVPLQDKVSPSKDNEVSTVESPMSVAYDSSMLSMSVSRDEIVQEEEMAVAQTEREMFFHVTEYRSDIYQYMREIEVKHRANPRYMRKQPDITHEMRTILVDWLAEVCEEYNQQSETLHLAVSYVDRFLSYMSVVRGKLQLVGTAATFIAAKYEEVYPPELGDFVYITDDTYTKREVLRMEHLILKVLSFDLSTPTSLAFVSHFCIANGYSKKLFHLAAYIAELSLLEADPYLQFKPSVIAAGALATARHCLLCKNCDLQSDTRLDMSAHPDCLLTAITPSLETSTGYTVEELEPCMRELARTHAHALLKPRLAIPEKYKTHKFDKVATIEPKAMYPVPKLQLASNPAATPTAPEQSQRKNPETVRVS